MEIDYMFVHLIKSSIESKICIWIYKIEEFNKKRYIIKSPIGNRIGVWICKGE